MADDNPSKLLVNSADYRTCNIVRNSCRYVCNKEYNAVSPDVFSDGDCRGRDPQDVGGTIGTDIDITQRECQMARNSNLYTPSNEYNSVNPNVFSDGDAKGREPQDAGGIIGNSIDIELRNCTLAKNAARYMPNNEYSAVSPDVFSDGDCKGRDPQNVGGTIGTNLDIDQRNCMLARNSGLYTISKPYGEGNC